MPHLFDTAYWEEGDSAGVVDMRPRPDPKPVSELKFFIDYTSIDISCSIPRRHLQARYILRIWILERSSSFSLGSEVLSVK